MISQFFHYLFVPIFAFKDITFFITWFLISNIYYLLCLFFTNWTILSFLISNFLVFGGFATLLCLLAPRLNRNTNGNRKLEEIGIKVDDDDPKTFVEQIKKKTFEGEIMEYPIDHGNHFITNFTFYSYMILVLLLVNYYDVKGLAIEVLVFLLGAFLGWVDDT